MCPSLKVYMLIVIFMLKMHQTEPKFSALLVAYELLIGSNWIIY